MRGCHCTEPRLHGSWIQAHPAAGSRPGAFSPSRAFTGGILVIRADGTGMRRLSDTGSFPVWWPDGKRVAYIDLGPDGVQRILSIPVEGGPPKPLGSIRFKGSNNPFDISPDGKLLASSSVVNLSSEVWLLQSPH